MFGPPAQIPLDGWWIPTARSNVTTYDRSIPPQVAGGTSFGCALNNNATPHVVGYGSTASGGTDALIWTYGAATAADLNTYAAGLVAATWPAGTSSMPTAFNNNGEVVGYGTLDGVSSAFALLYYGGPGDANGDGRVDVNDLTIVLTNFGKTGATWSQGEFTGDGTVDVNDLTIVLSNYGTTHGAGHHGRAGARQPGDGRGAAVRHGFGNCPPPELTCLPAHAARRGNCLLGETFASAPEGGQVSGSACGGLAARL